MCGWPEWGLPELGQLQLSWALPPSASAKPNVGWAGLSRSHILTSIRVAAEWPMPHSRFYRGGRRVADPAFSFLSWWPRCGRSSIHTSIVVAAEWSIPYFHVCGGRGEADPAFSIQSRRPRSGRSRILTLIVAAAEGLASKCQFIRIRPTGHALPPGGLVGIDEEGSALTVCHPL